MSLETLRHQIDAIDDTIITLLSRRMDLAMKTRSMKQTIEDPSREAKVIKRIRAQAGETLDPDFCERIYRLIIEESKRLQQL